VNDGERAHVKHRTGWSPEERDVHENDEALGKEPAAEGVDDSPRSTIEVIQSLIVSGREYASLEAERQKLRVTLAVSAIRYAALLGGIALFLLFGVLVALPVGAIWVLAPHVGPLAATLIVFLAGIAIIVLLLLLARAKIRRIFDRLITKSDTP
jgi:hypothetical protein